MAHHIDLFTARPHYGAVVADPAWPFDTWSEAGKGRSPDGFSETPALPLFDEQGERSAVNHYPTMPIDEIEALDVGQRESPHCVLFMWATFPIMPLALRVGAAWGFTYKTARVWAKVRRDGFDPALTLEQNFPIGTGYLARANPEPLLIFTRGDPLWRGGDPRTFAPRALMIAPRREHSRKPDCLHTEIERQVEGPYLEMFARQRRPGWDAWGNDIDHFEPNLEAA